MHWNFMHERTLSLCWIRIKSIVSIQFSPVHSPHNNFFMFQAICGPELKTFYAATTTITSLWRPRGRKSDKMKDKMGYFTLSQWFFNLMAHFGIQLKPLHFIDYIETLLPFFLICSQRKPIREQLFILLSKRMILFEFISKNR